MDLTVGAIIEGKVKSITNFGAFIALPENRTGMVHISEVANAYVNDIRQYLTEGQDVKVMVIALDPAGKINLSTKRREPKPAAPKPPQKPAGEGAAQEGGGDVMGRALDFGGNADERGAVDGVACQCGGGHNAGDDAGGAGAQAAGDGNVSLNVDGNGEGWLAPCGKRIDKADVDQVVLVLELLGAARDGELVGTLEGEVRVEADGHAEGVVADA